MTGVPTNALAPPMAHTARELAQTAATITPTATAALSAQTNTDTPVAPIRRLPRNAGDSRSSGAETPAQRRRE